MTRHRRWEKRPSQQQQSSLATRKGETVAESSPAASVLEIERAFLKGLSENEHWSVCVMGLNTLYRCSHWADVAAHLQVKPNYLLIRTSASSLHLDSYTPKRGISICQEWTTCLYFPPLFFFNYYFILFYFIYRIELSSMTAGTGCFTWPSRAELLLSKSQNGECESNVPWSVWKENASLWCLPHLGHFSIAIVLNNKESRHFLACLSKKDKDFVWKALSKPSSELHSSSFTVHLKPPQSVCPSSPHHC